MAVIETLPLLRNGEEYHSSTIQPLIGIHGEKLLDVSIAPQLHLEMALPITREVGFKKLANLSIDELITTYVEAGKIFANDMMIAGMNTSLDEFSELITRSTGMPITYVRNSMAFIQQFLTKNNLVRMLESNSPTGKLSIYNDNFGTRGKTTFGWVPRGKNCGVALPGNHPAVSLIGAITPLFKIPSIIRSSSSEPFSAYRLCKALWEAGLPYESLFHLVTEKSVVDSLLTKSDLGVVFGSDWTVNMYGNQQNVKVYGPGRSKMVIDFDSLSQELLDLSLNIAYNSISLEGGRACINLSGIIFNSNAGYDLFKDELAEKLAQIKPLDPLDSRAKLSALAKQDGERLYQYIRSRVDDTVFDLTAPYRGSEHFLRVKDELAYLLPTLLEVSNEHPMRTDEYPFIFGTITKASEQSVEELAKNSLSVSFLTDNPLKAKNLLSEPSIEKIFINDQTLNMDLAAPHEGFFTDFLYQSKATNWDVISD